MEWSDALIVRRSGEPALVHLPYATGAAVQKLSTRLKKAPAELQDKEVVEILRELWNIVVGPVARRLQWRVGGAPPGSRIWWCPMGRASRLPLHAAGPYAPGQPNLPDLFISSYTPTLGALIRARETRLRNPSGPSSYPTLLIIGQPETPNQIPLPNVSKELDVIRTQVPDATILEGDVATSEAVLDAISSHDWVHLACHGHHVPEDPFQSHFSMYDGNVSLRDIIRKNLPNAQLAFLSACHSAKVSETLPDEALHPAAGMLFAGYQSVIGTMWAFDDGVGSKVADKFYRLMLGGKLGPKDCSKAAEALARAVASLDDTVSMSQRINLVHFGV